MVNRVHENISQSSRGGLCDRRDMVELIRRRADMLCGMDRVMMDMYLKNGNSFRQMARLAGINEANVGRRIKKIIKRLVEGKYIVCLRNRERFSREEMAIAKDYFLMGISMRKIAERGGIKYCYVRKVVEGIEGKIERADERQQTRGNSF